MCQKIPYYGNVIKDHFVMSNILSKHRPKIKLHNDPTSNKQKPEKSVKFHYISLYIAWISLIPTVKTHITCKYSDSIHFIENNKNNYLENDKNNYLC